MTRKTAFSVVKQRFEAKGKTLLSTEEDYKDNKTKLRYRCGCGNDNCWITANQLGKGTDNCNPCAQKKRKETMVRIYGVENPSQSPEIQAKKRETCFANHGVEHPIQSPEIRARIQETMIQRHGAGNPSQIAEFQEKKKETWLQNLGVDHPFKSPEVLAKRRETWVENYGVNHPSKSEEIKTKKEETCFGNYGVRHPFQSPEIRARMRENYFAKHGVEHPMQNPEVFARLQASAFSKKDYTFPSGAIIKVQGYEPYAYDDLLKGDYTETELIDGYNQRPVIRYYFEDSQHSYYPDIYIIIDKVIVEVKSEFFFQMAEEKTKAKMLACAEQDYHSEIWIYGKSGNTGKLIQRLIFPAKSTLLPDEKSYTEIFYKP